MKKHFSYMMRNLLVLIFLCLFTVSLQAQRTAAGREFYQIKIYQLKDKAQGDRVDQFLKTAYLPALHKAGIEKVGVFKPVESDTAAGKRIYVLIPFQSMQQFAELDQKLQRDKAYTTAGKDYLDATHDNPPYQRIESILLQAFSEMPKMAAPDFNTSVSEQIYELRSYEGHTEKIYQNKVQMFNEGGEVEIFDDLGFNAVFYGEVLSGCDMPNLMYMTSFENMESRDKHWEAFRNAPAWKELSSRAEYQNNVSKADIFLLHPTDYSDI